LLIAIERSVQFCDKHLDLSLLSAFCVRNAVKLAIGANGLASGSPLAPALSTNTKQIAWRFFYVLQPQLFSTSAHLLH
jgi:hypothetical protein